MRDEIQDPRWLRVGDEPDDELSEEGKVALLDLRERALDALEAVSDVAAAAKAADFDDVEASAGKVASSVNGLVAEIESEADYWGVNI